MPRSGSSIFHPRLVDHLTTWRGRGLPDTCTIHVPSTAAGSTNPTTLELTPAAPTVLYDGPTLCQPAPAAERDAVAGDDVTIVRRYYASVEADVATVPLGAVYTLTASKSAAIVGRAMVVVDVHYDSIDSRRLLVLEEQQPAREGTGL